MQLWWKKTSPNSRPILSPDEISVSGERYHKHTIEKLILEYGGGRLNWRTNARLSRDLDNPKDQYAIEILVQGERIGYIHRDHCEKIWKQIGTHGVAIECSIRWNGEPTNGVYDVKLFPPL
jgi:hypothetical protein